jgi:hypothetical protein
LLAAADGASASGPTARMLTNPIVLRILASFSAPAGGADGTSATALCAGEMQAEPACTAISAGTAVANSPHHLRAS